MKIADINELCIKYGAIMDLQDIGAAVRDAREQQSLSQTEAGKPLGMSRSTISGLENGTISEVGVRKILALCESLGLELVVRPRETRALGWQEQLDENAAMKLAARNDQARFERNRLVHQNDHQHDSGADGGADADDGAESPSPRP